MQRFQLAHYWLGRTFSRSETRERRALTNTRSSRIRLLNGVLET